jgi:hypothetical protein
MQQTGNMPSHRYARMAANWVPGTGPYNQVIGLAASLGQPTHTPGPLQPTLNPVHPSYASPFPYNNRHNHALYPTQQLQYPNTYHHQYYNLPTGQSASLDQYHHLPTEQSSEPDEYQNRSRYSEEYGMPSPATDHVDDSVVPSEV